MNVSSSSKDQVGNENQSSLGLVEDQKTCKDDAELNSSSESAGTEDDDDLSNIPLTDFSIDNQLEEKLKKHGLNRRNAKTIIHELLNNQSVRSLLKANLDDDDQSTDFPIAKALRSTAKKQPSSFENSAPAFSDLSLPDEDDEDDEYKPELDGTEDTQTSAATADLDTSVEGSDLPSTSKTFLEELNEIHAEMDAIDEKASNNEEIIAKRTRSKHSLLDTAISEIETAFNPPDVTDDMYAPSGDSDWHHWLAELMMDETLALPEAVTAEVEDDQEKDPDYNFLASEGEDVNETEDYRDDHATHISKKEVQELLELLDAPSPDYRGQYVEQNSPPVSPPQPAPTPAQTVHELPTYDSHPASMSSASHKQSSEMTVKQRLAVLKKHKNDLQVQESCLLFAPQEQRASSAPQSQNSFQFSDTQLRVLDLQMRQHVQLLSQVNLLCRNMSSLSTIVHDSHALLKELKQLGDYNRSVHHLSKSCFDSSNLAEALIVAQLAVNDSDPVIRLTKYERSRGLQPLPRGIATVMASSPVFQFSRLLPTCAAVGATGENARASFLPAEDNLLALGVAQMEGHTLPSHVLIQRYMMPCKQPEQIRFRITNANNGHYRPDHPIRVYGRTGNMPQTPLLPVADAGVINGAVNLLQLRDNKLPDWLIALQQERSPHRKSLQSARNVDTSSTKLKNKISKSHVFSAPLPTVNTVAITPHSPVVVAQISTLPSGAIILPAMIASPVPARVQLTSVQGRRSGFGLACQPSTPRSKKKTKRLLENIRKTFSPSKNKTFSRRSRPPIKKPKFEDGGRPQDANTTNPGAVSLHSEEVADNSKAVTVQRLETAVDATESPSVVAIGESASSSSATDRGVTKPVGAFSDCVAAGTETIPVANFENPDAMETEITSKTEVCDKPKESSCILESVPADAEDDAIMEEDDFDQDTEDENKTVEEDDNLTEEEEILGTQEGAPPSQDNKSSNWDGKMKSRKEKRALKVKWKNRTDKSSNKLGGKLHRLHPGLADKKVNNKSKPDDDDQLGKNLRASAKNVRLLEEDTIVQLDPTRVEKEMLFAQGYLNRIRNVLQDHPDVLLQALEILCQFDLDSTQAPSALFDKLSEILKPWPQLLQGFAPFLLPEQAQTCGLLKEQQVYARARKFLRQLEIRFHDNPQHLNRILNAFHAVAESGIYNVQEMKTNISSLLKADAYLQEEFLMFFDDERPPESRLHGEHEEVIWSDDLLKDTTVSTRENIFIHSSDGQDTATNPEEGQSDDLIKSPPSSQARQNAQNLAVSKERVDPEVKECNTEEVRNTEEKQREPAWGGHRSDEDTDEDDEDVGTTDHLPSPCLPTDIGVISEDAQSCSPFKRHSSTSVANDAVDTPVRLPRPPTPVPTQTLQEPVFIDEYCFNKTDSSSLGSDLPHTPTASPRKSLPDDVHTSAQLSERPWTRDEDAQLLGVCKELGASDATIDKVAASLKRSSHTTRQRFHHLMALLAGECLTDDTDTASIDSESDDAYTA